MNLSYRKHGLSKAAKRRLILLGSIFMVSLIGFIAYFNVETDIFSQEEIKKATLPTLSVTSEGEVYGNYFGYIVPADIGRMRNGLIPLGPGREVTYNINTYGTIISGISYEITTGDGDRKIASGEAKNIEKDGDTIKATLSLSNLIDEGREYMMIIRLNESGKNIEYYTRIKYIEDGRHKECIDFAKYFTNTALSGRYEELATYIEPDGSESDKGMAHITIKSSLDEVGWKGFDFESYTEPDIQFSEIDSNYTSIVLNYYITGDRQTNPGIFSVKEYYRMRKGEERIFLLDYERSLTQILTQESIAIENDKLVLGQNAYDVEYLANNTGTNVAFVWDGALYEYNATNNSLIGVFNFGEKNVDDPRTTHVENGIHIMDIDENGKITYTVFGYMNAGAHEGVCGVGLYYYDPTEDVTTEQAFLATNHSYSSISSGFTGDIFLSSQGNLYVDIEDDLIRLNQSDGKVERFMSQHKRTTYALSREGRFLAYTDEEGRDITVVDLFTSKSEQITLEPEKRYRVLAFMGEDLVYGIVPEDMYTEDNMKNNIYPMEEIIISDISSSKEPKVLKNYRVDGRYITSVSKTSDYMINIKISSYIGDGVFREEDVDVIQNTIALKGASAKMLRVGDGGIKDLAIEFLEKSISKIGSSVTIKNTDSFNITYYDGPVLNPIFNVEQGTKRYYAYRGMDIVASGDFAADAIESAYAGAGYCVDSDGNYIWQYGRGNSRKEIDLLSVDKVDKIRVNLLGCDLDEVLSYIYRGYPVYVSEGSENQLIIVGFDENIISFYQMDSAEIQTMLIDEATKLVENRGKMLSTYIIK